MKILNIDEQTKMVQLELSQDDLLEAIHTKDGVVVNEVELADSSGWCGEEPSKIGMRVGHLISDSEGKAVEVVVRAGKDWSVRSVVPLQDILFPMGLPNDTFKEVIKEAGDAASRLSL